MSDRARSLSADEMLMQATCAIVEKRDGEDAAIATAWLLSEQGHLVTAGHTFLRHGRPVVPGVDKAWVQFLDEPPAEAVLQHVVFEQEQGIDFAILKLVSPPTGRRPLRIMLVNRVEGDFLLRGYGTNLPYSQSGGKGEFRPRNIRAYRAEYVLFQLLSPELAYEGYSGGAVYSTQLEAVVAIQTEAKPATQTILAMPLYRVVEYWEEIQQLAALPGTCFVIAPQGRLDTLADEIVRPVVTEECGYEVKTSQPGQVGLLDLGRVEQAELIVADVTGNRAEVIYELAAGHGAGIPDIILGEQAEYASYREMPFSVLPIEIANVEQAREQLRSRIRALKKTMDDLEGTPTNLITKSLRAPLTQLSPAYGLALGHFYNFVKHVGDALLDAPIDSSIKVIVGDEQIPPEQCENVVLTIVIPRRLEWADHEYINRIAKRFTVSASVLSIQRPRPFTLWALKDREDGLVQLVDIFPTAMGVIARAIDQRLNVTDPGQRSNLTWREIEEKEIHRFSSSLLRLIQSNAALSEKVRVRSWQSVFPALGEGP